jgi:uncharacterized protein
LRIIVDIGHPAHVHYFKNMIHILQKKGHQFLVTARDKDMAHYLLHHENIHFYSRGKGSDSILGKIIYLIKADIWMHKLAKTFKPDLFISFGSPYATHAAKLTGTFNIIFDDTENAIFGQAFYRPFTRWVYSPKSFIRSFGYHHVKFDSYMELCYLHPNYYKTDSNIKNELGLSKGDKYVILRFVSWNAHHDIGQYGMSLQSKINAVKSFAKHCQVFISSEGVLPKELEKYRFPLAPERMHFALSEASLFFGESATMASESAVLGTPAIYIDNTGRGYTTEQQEKYGIVWNFSGSDKDQDDAINQGVHLLINDQKEKFVGIRATIHAEKIDLTAYMVKLIETFPIWANRLKSKPDLQYTI